MTHALRRKCAENPIAEPLVASLRYRCACANNEVLTVHAVLGMDCDEERFVWTMRMLWRDVKFEVAQHVGKAK